MGLAELQSRATCASCRAGVARPLALAALLLCRCVTCCVPTCWPATRLSHPPHPPTYPAADVALHQAIKYSPAGKQLLVLGQAGKPGSGPDAFCKPTQVAVGRDGSIYVAGARSCKIWEACADRLG